LKIWTSSTMPSKFSPGGSWRPRVVGVVTAAIAAVLFVDDLDQSWFTQPDL
jgi:hypothetical protein